MALAPRDGLLLVPFAAAALGVSVVAPGGVPARVFAPNLLAGVLGLLSTGALVRARPEHRDRVGLGLAGVAFGVLLLTLVAPGIEHVHRWVPLGPLRLHASAALLPWILGAVASSDARGRAYGLALALGAQLVHVAQPDAAQATALAVGLLPLLASGRGGGRGRALGLGLLVSLLAAASWTRGDPLLPVAHVERVLVLAAERGPGWVLAGLGVFALACVPLRPDATPLGRAFTLYFLTTLGVTFLGPFPVPLVGAGAGPVLGWYAMVACLRPRDADRR